jgi:hypothetical protein
VATKLIEPRDALEQLAAKLLLRGLEQGSRPLIAGCGALTILINDIILLR